MGVLLKMIFVFYLLGNLVLFLIVAIFALIYRLISIAGELWVDRGIYYQKIKDYFKAEYQSFEIRMTCKLKDHDFDNESGACRRGCGRYKVK